MALGTLPMDMATALELCLQNALAANPNPPADTCIYNGEDFRTFLSAGLTEDRCCSGFAGVRIAGIRPSVPVEGVLEHCGVRVWQVDLEMGVARCSPVGDINSGPTCAQLTEVAEQVQLDASAMVDAVCCLRPQVASGLLAPTAWTPFGPEGGCTGGIMGVTVVIDACGCTS